MPHLRINCFGEHAGGFGQVAVSSFGSPRCATPALPQFGMDGCWHPGSLYVRTSTRCRSVGKGAHVAERSSLSTLRPRVIREKTGLQRLLDELRFVRRRRGDGNGDRKTSAVCKGHDLGAFAALGFPDAPAWRWQRSLDERFAQVETAPCVQVARERLQHAPQGAVVHPALEPTMAGLIRRISFGEILPRRSGPQDQRIPFSTSRGSRHGRPRRSRRSRGFGRRGSSIAHCASIRSIPCGTTDRRISCTDPSRVYETASNVSNPFVQPIPLRCPFVGGGHPRKVW